MAPVSPMIFIGVGIAVLGEILHIVGLGTLEWAVFDTSTLKTEIGLFKSCIGSICKDNDESKGIFEDYAMVEATQAMTILGMLCGLVGVVAAIITLVFKLLSKSLNSMLPIISLGACCGACLFIIIGVIIFGVGVFQETVDKYKVLNIDIELGYSFALCIVGAILLPTGGALVYVGGKGEE